MSFLPPRNRLLGIIGVCAAVIAATIRFSKKPDAARPLEQARPTFSAAQVIGGADRVSPDPAISATKVELPFIGPVETNTSQEVVKVSTSRGAEKLPFTVYRRKDGVFLRAEFFKEGSVRYEEPAEKLQRFMHVSDQTIVGVPGRESAVPWQQLVTKFGRDLGEDMGNATGIVVTYVDYKRPSQIVAGTISYETEAVFLVHVYGVATIMEDFPDVEINRRIRGVYNSAGQLLKFDNCL